jgi:hypothetical protein
MSSFFPRPLRQAPPIETAVILLALAFFIAVLFQTVQLIRERANLAAILERQETPVQDMLKLRDQVNSLAGDTALLARSGNAAAQQVVDDLQRQHITVHPPSQQPNQTEGK